MSPSLATTMRLVAEPSREVLREHVDEVVGLKARVERYLDAEVLRWLGTMPPEAELAARHLIDAGGKRVRPTLAFLAAGAAGGDLCDATPVATAVELLHTGTLLHDDVIDQSDTRRGRAAAHTIWDNSVAILSGDFCYFAALDALLGLRDLAIMEHAMRVARELAHGELLQLARRKTIDPTTTRADCLAVITRKTASLFEFACAAGARAAGADRGAVEACAELGRELGIAFQIVDDRLDFVGDPARLGKGVAQDLECGNLTLPIVLAGEARPGLVESWAAGAISAEAMIEAVRDSGALDTARALAEAHSTRARAALARLPETAERALLEHIVARLITRLE